MDLKIYQQTTLDILDGFLSSAKLLGVSRAFEKFRLSDKVSPSAKLSDDKELFDKLRNAEGYESIYKPLPELADVPYVCLRLPTGGGKTLIGTLAIRSAAENFLECDFPFVLWLVPSNEIRQQTLRVLRAPNSFYGKELRKTFSRVNIFDVSDFRNLRVDDMRGLNICVATFQSIKREAREGLKVYQAVEELTPLFRNIPHEEFFHVDEHGRHESFANLLAYLRPLMIVDEAHNNSTPLALDVTEQLRPSAVIELTATPSLTNSNVLVKVSATELEAEDMIKFPLKLGEIDRSPEKTLDYAIQKLAALEKLAATEEDYIRPIALYQAENKNRPYNVEYIEKYLREVAKIPDEQIAVATGTRRELDGVDLKSPDCPIRHIITVQALKEGWDCPFASVFCSLATTHSPKDAEQLLGRVLRMPYAKKRRAAALNKAYAFVCVASWEEAVNKIKDNLRGMGFDKQEVDKMLGDKQQRLIDVEFMTQDKPNFNAVNLFIQNRAEITEVDSGFRTVIHNATEGELHKLADNRNIIFCKPEDREKFLRAVRGDFTPSTPEKKTPAERGVKFSIPQLCLDFGYSKPFVAERDDFFPQDGWSLTDTHDYELPISHASDDAKFYELNFHGERVTVQLLDNEQNLFGGVTTWTQTNLIGWLSRSFHDEKITDADFREFTRRALDELERDKNFSLAELVRLRFTLNKLLKDKVDALISAAIKRGWQKNLFDTPIARVDKNIAFTFDNENYHPTTPYTGDKIFGKHFYREVGHMNPEEVSCAQYIDANPRVETWIRNLERDAENSFWLQTSSDRFYPDFVVKLTDGTFAAVEYKGAHLAGNDDSREKELLGELWANKSNGLCKFIMAVKTDERGRNLSTQLNEFFLGG